ncbi:MAG: hypothetical protein VB878_16340 [Pirellulaceae bacterium]
MWHWLCQDTTPRVRLKAPRREFTIALGLAAYAATAYGLNHLP